MSEETVETFTQKILRMFIPMAGTRKFQRAKEPGKDLEISDPLERFENAIKRESEKERLKREESSR